MTIPTEIAAMRIAREVREAEDALADALIKQSTLFTSMVSARRDAAVGPFTGQDALLRLAQSQQSLLAAGNDLARVHGKLADLAEEVTGTGGDGCPPASGRLEPAAPAITLAA